MNNEEKLFELMTRMYGDMQEGFKDIRERLDKAEKSIVTIEVDHGKKLDALFDGYKQNAEKLTRIEEEVSRHEEIILRRVR